MATVSELRAALEAAEAAEWEEQAAISRARTAEWKLILSDPNSWEWRATPELWPSEERLGAVVVGCRVKPWLVPSWATSMRKNDNGWTGMVYYRTEEGILTHSGGGSMILRDPMLCDDEEWADICAGNPAVKYRKPF